MRRSLVVFILAALALAPAAYPAPVFLVDGRGWGHGIGMAQYGAYGYAREEGRSYSWILAHYYRGTTLGSTPVDAVRVLLADDRGSLTVGSEAAFSVTDANDRTYRLPAGNVRLGRELRIEVDGETRTLASPARFSRGSRVLELGGRPYRGQLVVRSSGGTLSAVNHVGLDEYLYGVVPDEMPPSWSMEALKAQAVAARSYAVVSRRSSGVFDLYSDTRSQVYGGVASEEARTNAAVNATAGEVVLHGGKVAYTFFHSTSGGRTAAIHDVWNAAPVPYLVSVPDPYDRLSPHHRWGPFRYTSDELAARLGSARPAGRLLDVTVTRNASQRADVVVLRGSRGTSRISADSFQARLGLRSTWFSVGVLSLGGSSRVVFGGKAVLRGVARGVGRVTVERRAWNGNWERVGAVKPTVSGDVRAVASPASTTWFRLSSSRGKSDAHRVAVAPLVRFSEFRGGDTLTGFVRPARPGARVAVQRLGDAGWLTIARAQTDERGRFSATLALEPGTYRAVATLGPGFVPGMTPRLRVVTR